MPQSFLDQFHGALCTRFQLILGSLLDWHIRYGNEDSAMAAVRFLEGELSPNLGTGFARDFAAIWQRGARDGETLLERERQLDADFDGDRFLRGAEQDFAALDSFKALRAQADRLENAEFIAGEYTRAAEALGSRKLLDEARRVHDPARAAVMYIDNREQLGGIDAFLADRLRPAYRSDRMSPEMRDLALAVTDAFLSRDSRTVMAADLLTRQIYRPDERSYPYPDMLTFTLEAYENDDAACNADEHNSREGYEDRCEENGFEQSALGFWYQRSRIELLAQQLGLPLDPLDRPTSREGATPRTIDLFIRKAWQEGMRYGDALAPPEAVRLLILSAQTNAAAISKVCKEVDENQTYDVLRPISRAQTLASPSSQPELYREVAQVRLQVQEVLNACGANISERHFEIDYLLARSFLNQYDEFTADD